MTNDVSSVSEQVVPMQRLQPKLHDEERERLRTFSIRKDYLSRGFISLAETFVGVWVLLLPSCSEVFRFPGRTVAVLRSLV